MLALVAWSIVGLSVVGWGAICVEAAQHGEMGPLFFTWGIVLLWAVLYVLFKLDV
jgi:hypothetical protein